MASVPRRIQASYKRLNASCRYLWEIRYENVIDFNKMFFGLEFLRCYNYSLRIGSEIMHNHSRVNGLFWNNKAPNLTGLKQQWFTSCSHDMSRGWGRLLLLVVRRGSRLKEISPGDEQMAHRLSKFSLGSDAHHVHSYFIGQTKSYSHA